jgi:hypothetical protein
MPTLRTRGFAACPSELADQAEEGFTERARTIEPATLRLRGD